MTTGPPNDEPADRADLTAEEAAEFLNVSRGHLETLLDGGAVPSRTTGSGRTVPREALAGYKRAFLARRHAALDELAALSQELGTGY